MKRSDLKTGHILEFNNGRKAFVLRNLPNKNDDQIIYQDGFDSLEHMNENMIWVNDFGPARQVQKVYETTGYGAGMKNLLECGSDIRSINTKLVWERKPSIDIDIRINGKKASLSDISEETLLSLRNEN